MFNQHMHNAGHSLFGNSVIPPLPAELAAVWGSFLYEGLMDASRRQRETEILTQWRHGCIELIEATCALLPRLWELAYRHWAAREEPGVFEYEVVSPFGFELGIHLLEHHGQLPSPADTETMLRTLVARYYQVLPSDID